MFFTFGARLFLRWVAPRNLWQPLPSAPSRSCTCRGTSGGGKARGGLYRRSGSRSAFSSSPWLRQWPVKLLSGRGCPELVVTPSVWHIATVLSQLQCEALRLKIFVLMTFYWVTLKRCQRTYWQSQPCLQVCIHYSILLAQDIDHGIPHTPPRLARSFSTDKLIFNSPELHLYFRDFMCLLHLIAFWTKQNIATCVQCFSQ